ncbi:hypothetical protein AB2M62_10550 [Sphingomonas sp. MMS12-HWE2-04]|uniref:hypothetical protein n=1 Tax=Sphingomonas sp. MMS12-HWE2-04 TaxID=3234199 RepID=UPI00384BF4E4
MKTSPTKARIGLAALLLAGASVPAIGQDTPESLLPPGFNDPAPTPTPAPTAPSAAVPSQPAAPAAGTEDVPVAALNLNFSDTLGNASVAAEQVDLARYELPEFAKHSLRVVGAFASGNAAFPANGFGTADGRYLATLMRRLDAPVASRWVSIVLRRALMSPLDTPPGANGADFAAERAWVLLRMGEVNAARAVIEDVDTDNYTTRLLQVAMQTALASGDPGAMCPIVEKGVATIEQRGWALAQAMCAGLAGKPDAAGDLLRQARRGTSASDIDNLLAEKVVGTGAQGRRAVTIEWPGVSELTAWRWGLATATGVEVPDDLYATAGPQVRYWQALAPNIDPAARVASAELAASAGVFSSAGLVDLYGEIEQAGDAGGAATVARDLRTAFSASDVGDRVKALRTLWDGADTPRGRYARLILTARAASWIPASKTIEAPETLIASMLSAGYDAPAMEWRADVAPGSAGWGLVTLADPVATGGIAAGDLDSFSEAQGRRKGQLLLAGLAGLGRLSAADAQRSAAALDVPIGAGNAWTQAIDAAGQRGDAATVALLAATGMQSRTWNAVRPEALFHIVAAMRAAGMANYARMVAVEAITRA